MVVDVWEKENLSSMIWLSKSGKDMVVEVREKENPSSMTRLSKSGKRRTCIV